MSEAEYNVPLNGHPTEVLAARFDAWRKVIRALNVYLREVANAQDDAVRIHMRLIQSLSMPMFQTVPEGGPPPEPVPAASRPRVHGLELAARDELQFEPYGSQSIGDVQADIIMYHRAQAAAGQRIAREIERNVIPRLEELRRELLTKQIKEVKACAGNFRNSVAREQQQAAASLQQYVGAIEQLTRNGSAASTQGKNDPYLLKTAVDRQLYRTVKEENGHLDSYLKFQSEGRELEKVVVHEVQKALSTYAKLIGVQGQSAIDSLTNKLLSGFVAKEPTWEWDQLIARDTVDFADPKSRPRDVNEIGYQYQYSNLATEVRSGYLERRSKYLKSYSKAWYVLTPTFLHEFKSSDRRHDPNPVMSLSLDDCSVSTDDHHASASHKFVLHARQAGGVHRGHKWVFRAESADKLQEWFKDLSRLTALKSPVERARLLPGTVEGVPPPRDAAAALSPGSTIAADRTTSMRTQHTVTSKEASTTGVGAAGVGAAGVGAVGGTAGGAAGGAAGGSGSADAAANQGAVRSTHAGGEQLAVPGASPETGGAVPAAAAAGTAAVGAGIAAAAHHRRDRHPDESDEAQAVNDREQYYQIVPPISSPVPSDNSGVTSNGEPFQANEPSIDRELAYDDDAEDERRPERAAISSDVNLSHAYDADEAADPEKLHHEAVVFVTPKELGNGAANTAVDDQDSVFSYDLTHSASTYVNDKDFKPVEADVPVNVERRLTQTRHKEEDPAPGIGVARTDSVSEDAETLLNRRRSSVASAKRRPSRRATGSYGTTDELKPLTSATSADNAEPAPLFFANGLPSTTGGSETATPPPNVS